MKLLYAEDNPVFQTLLGEMLTRWGYQVEITGNGDEALRRLVRPDGPQLAILDWSMPGLDGIEVCRQVRAAHQGHYVYIILLTGHDEGEDLVLGLEAGADDYLTKPVNLQELRLRLRSATRLLDFEERFSSLFEEAPVAYHEVDQDGTIIRVNRAECKLLGYPAPEILGKPAWDFVTPAQRDQARTATQSRLAGDVVPEAVEHEYTTQGGAVRILQIHENPIRDERGRIAGLRSALLDVTDNRRQEEERARYTAELTRSNAELQQFAYVASHDLQEPLRMVASYTQLIARRYRGKLDADADEFIAFAVDGAKRMQGLISDLLAYSRVSTRTEEHRSIDASAVLDKALENLRLSISESGAIVTRDPMPAVVADPLALGQLFQNLIGNALKFRGGNAPAVHIGAAIEDGMCRFWVRDNGIGIDPKSFERIFQVFQRLHTNAEYPGTGIGLAICKKIVERHGGRIWVESERGRGAAFYFTMPAAAAARTTAAL